MCLENESMHRDNRQDKNVVEKTIFFVDSGRHPRNDKSKEKNVPCGLPLLSIRETCVLSLDVSGAGCYQRQDEGVDEPLGLIRYGSA